MEPAITRLGDRPLATPIALDVTSRGDPVVVSSGRFDIYGAGRTVKEATEDAGAMLLALYDDLSSSEESLSTHYREVLDEIRTAIHGG